MKTSFFIIPGLAIVVGCATPPPAGISSRAAKVVVSRNKQPKDCK